MTTSQQVWAVFLAALLGTGLLSLSYLAAVGNTETNLLVLLRWSARLAFLILLAAFIARPLQQLLRRPWTTRLLHRRRLLGVAFAGVQFAHLGQILYRSRLSDSFVFSPLENLGGALVYLVVLAMFVTSFDAPARALGRRRWNALHTFGIYGLFAAFAVAVWPASLATATPLGWVFVILAGAAIGLRLLAGWQRLRT